MPLRPRGREQWCRTSKAVMGEQHHHPWGARPQRASSHRFAPPPASRCRATQLAFIQQRVGDGGRLGERPGPITERQQSRPSSEVAHGLEPPARRSRYSRHVLRGRTSGPRSPSDPRRRASSAMSALAPRVNFPMECPWSPSTPQRLQHADHVGALARERRERALQGHPAVEQASTRPEAALGAEGDAEGPPCGPSPPDAAVGPWTSARNRPSCRILGMRRVSEIATTQCAGRAPVR
jgi:hypothetical protein